jgi:hypothetical protein
MKTEQNRPIRIQELTKIVMGRSGFGLAEERLVPTKAGRNVLYTNNRPCAFHRIFLEQLSFLCATLSSDLRSLTITFSGLGVDSQVP